MIQNIIQTFSELPETATTIILLLLLVTVLAVAYKTMAIVMQTIIISILSAVFYLALWYLEIMPFSLRNLLLFTFLGAALYIGFTLLQTGYKIAKTTITIPIEIITLFYKILAKIEHGIVRTVKKITGEEKKTKKKSNKQKKDKDNSDDDNTKEVVIDKVNKDNDKKDND